MDKIEPLHSTTEELETWNYWVLGIWIKIMIICYMKDTDVRGSVISPAYSFDVSNPKIDKQQSGRGRGGVIISPWLLQILALSPVPVTVSAPQPIIKYLQITH